MYFCTKKVHTAARSLLLRTKEGNRDGNQTAHIVCLALYEEEE